MGLKPNLKSDSEVFDNQTNPNLPKMYQRNNPQYTKAYFQKYN